MLKVVNIAEIDVNGRVRSDMGDLAGLAKSIEENGLLQPILINKENKLIAGQRRMEATKLLGCTSISAMVVDVPNNLIAERDENTERKDFTPTELARIGMLIEEQYRVEHAEEYARVKREGYQRRIDKSFDLSMPSPNGNRCLQHAAGLIGMGPSTFQRAKAVVQAADADPQKYGDLPAVMDKTTVNGAYHELTHRKQGLPSRHPLLHGTRRRQVYNEVPRGITKLGDLISVFEASIEEYEQLDPSARHEWAGNIRRLVNRLNKVCRRLEA